MTVDAPPMTAWERVRSLLLWIAAFIGAACIVLFVAGLIWNVRAQIVTSGSMEPAIPTGSVILVQTTQADTVRVGDIVTVGRANGSGLVTHRVIETQATSGGTELTLQGDANSSPDPNTYVVTTVGTHLLTVPGMGYALVWIRTPIGVTSMALAAVFVLLAYFLGGHRGQNDDQEEPAIPSDKHLAQ